MRTIFTFLLLVLAACTSSAWAAETTWPLVLKGQSATYTIYTPQFDAQTAAGIEGRAAVMVQRPGSSAPVFGAIAFTATVAKEHSASLIPFESVSVVNTKFPSDVSGSDVLSWMNGIAAQMTNAHIVVGSDVIQASSSKTPLKTDPPTIIIRYVPSLLVLIDGEPKFVAIDDTRMERIANSPFLIIREKGSSTLWLYGATKWFTATAVDGPWTVVNNIPQSIKDVEAQVLAKQQAEGIPAATPPSTIPDIVVSTKPAELISFTGQPAFEPIAGTNLLGATNTDASVLMDITSQRYYTVLSGRWYSAAKTSGPWTFQSSDALPQDFKKIPEGSKFDEVLAYVSGTPASKQAVLDATAPTVTAVDRSKATCTVVYDGEPIFKPVDGTTMQYAANTQSTVLMQGSDYWCCDNGIWFHATSAKGPWTVTDARPQQVESIQPSSPVYNTKYVYVYQSTPQVVYMGYTPGYMGCYVYGPTVVYGTGFYYYPWYGAYYYPRPMTYGFHMGYSPYMGWHVGFGVTFGGPAGWVHIGYGYRPGYHPGYWGPPMYRPPYGYHHPPHGYYGPRATPPVTRPAGGIYDQRPGSMPAQRPSTLPSGRPSNLPSNRPSTLPTTRPSTMPTTRPSTMPSTRPSTMPTTRPSTMPTTRPSGGGGGRRR